MSRRQPPPLDLQLELAIVGRLQRGPATTRELLAHTASLFPADIARGADEAILLLADELTIVGVGPARDWAGILWRVSQPAKSLQHVREPLRTGGSN